MNILQRVAKIWVWLRGNFETVAVDAANVAVSITEHIKTGLDSGIGGFLATLFDNLTHSHIGADIIATLQKTVPAALAVELGVTGLPANPTDAEKLDFENRIIAAFKAQDDHSKLYIVFSTQVYLIVHQLANKGAQVTFSDGLDAVKEAWLDYKADASSIGTDASS